MKQNVVVITDARAAAEVLRNADQKIVELNQFRFDPTVPDLLASEGNDWDIRARYLRPALEALRLSEEVVSTIITQNLKAVMHKYEQSNELLNMHELSCCLSFDILCKELCDYDLSATVNMAQQGAINGEGAEIFRSLKSLNEAKIAKGVYISPTDRKVVPDGEIAAAQSNLKSFFNKIAESAQMAAKNAPSLKASESFVHALLSLSEVDPDIFSKKNVNAELGQCIRHGQDALSSTICWAFYALSSNFKVL
jgi:cytochrome P450